MNLSELNDAGLTSELFSASHKYVEATAGITFNTLLFCPKYRGAKKHLQNILDERRRRNGQKVF